MAGRFTRIPRFTLFSGPNCSLCDTAKAELDKVRQQRPFRLDIINIHDKGQENWKKKYVYWIPALHLEGKEIAKGRWDAHCVTDALAKWDQQQKQQNQSQDTEEPQHPYGWYDQCGLYQRHTHVPLGEEVNGTEQHWEQTNLCFNCGSPDHAVSACPFPQDKELISLSRQYFAFYKELRGTMDYPRFHEVESWRQKRLDWLDAFEPGQIKSPLLQEAIQPGDGDWLRNIAIWGYPPGWVSAQDPRELVRARILAEHAHDNDDCETAEPFYIINTHDDIEEVSKLRHGNDEATETESDITSVSSSHSRPVEAPVRWARYPPTYFSSDLLPVYHKSDPSLVSAAEWNVLLDGEYDYLTSIYQTKPPASEAPPVPSLPPPPRDPPPPPPPGSPPPIPPPSPPPSPFSTLAQGTFPLPRQRSLSKSISTELPVQLCTVIEDGEEDMELSDSE